MAFRCGWSCSPVFSPSSVCSHPGKPSRRARKSFIFFFLLQQTAMIGVFVALDMFLYYGFWELSLVPMAILIAMFGRERGPQTALKFFCLHLHPVGAASCRDSLALRQDRHLRLRRRCSSSHHQQPALSPAGSVVGGARIPRRLCCQSPGLPAARLAQRYHLRGSDGDGHGRRRQARPLLHPPLQPRTLPRAGARFRPADDRPRRHRHTLRRVHRTGADQT